MNARALPPPLKVPRWPRSAATTSAERYPGVWGALADVGPMCRIPIKMLQALLEVDARALGPEGERVVMESLAADWPERAGSTPARSGTETTSVHVGRRDLLGQTARGARELLAASAAVTVTTLVTLDGRELPAGAFVAEAELNKL